MAAARNLRPTASLALLLSLPTLGCATAQPVPDAAPVVATAAARSPAVAEVAVAPPPVAGPGFAERLQRVEAIRSASEARMATRAVALWGLWTEGRLPTDIAALQVPSREDIELVRAAAAADTARRASLMLLANHLASERLEAAGAAEAAQAAAIEGGATVPYLGREVPFHDVERLAALEPDLGRRRALWAATGPVLDRLHPIQERRLEQMAAEARRLGYPNLAAFAAELRVADLGQLAQRAEQFLSDTDALVPSAVDALTRRELGLDLPDVRRADLPRLVHHAAVRSAFPADRMRSTLDRLLQPMGLSLTAIPGLVIDDRDLPRKSPRALCLPIHVPGDVRISFKPQGGVDDFAALFHEAGHAVALSLASGAPDWERAQLGSAAVSEAFSVLLEDRLDDERFLSDLGMTGELLSTHLLSAATKSLLLARRTAARFLDEQATLAGAGPSAERWQQLMARAYGFPFTAADAKRHLLDQDDLLGAADHLRGQFLAAQLEAHLVKGFGERFWLEPKAGELLRALLKEGSALDPEALSVRLGATELDGSALADSLKRRLVHRP